MLPLLLPALLAPGAIQATAPKANQPNPIPPKVTFDHAAIALLTAYDAGRLMPPMPDLAPADRPAYRWLRDCTLVKAGSLPENPFPSGPKRIEAEAFRALLGLTPAEAVGRLPHLQAQELGTWMGLWRWGQAQVRAGAWDRAQRRTWEDRLLAGKGLDLIQGYAFRHALCFALAEKDEARLGDLRGKTPEDQDDLFAAAQVLFGHLGHPLPTVRLWTLPGLRLDDRPLAGLGGNRVWIAPFEGTLPRIPPGCAWVVPTAGGVADPTEATLDEVSTTEAGPVVQALQRTQDTAWLAPSRADFERLGLVHFPAFLRFDAEGRLVEVRMGDAAPAQPGF
ncbi:MAG TPA: hypothetical protein VJ623_04315 [Holophagaceae bacterium]|nr:hypothetical protein [Holophagaceae bacterium]